MKASEFLMEMAGLLKGRWVPYEDGWTQNYGRVVVGPYTLPAKCCMVNARTAISRVPGMYLPGDMYEASFKAWEYLKAYTGVRSTGFRSISDWNDAQTSEADVIHAIHSAALIAHSEGQ